MITKQKEAVNTILGIHRELQVVDEVHYDLVQTGNDLTLIIAFGEKFYHYKISPTGFFTGSYRYMGEPEHSPLSYFSK